MFTVDVKQQHNNKSSKPPFLLRADSYRKSLPSQGLECIPFRKDFGVQGRKQEVTKVVPLCDNGKKNKKKKGLVVKSMVSLTSSLRRQLV